MGQQGVYRRPGLKCSFRSGQGDLNVANLTQIGDILAGVLLEDRLNDVFPRSPAPPPLLNGLPPDIDECFKRLGDQVATVLKANVFENGTPKVLFNRCLYLDCGGWVEIPNLARSVVPSVGEFIHLSLNMATHPTLSLRSCLRPITATCRSPISRTRSG